MSNVGVPYFLEPVEVPKGTLPEDYPILQLVFLYRALFKAHIRPMSDLEVGGIHGKRVRMAPACSIPGHMLLNCMHGALVIASCRT